MQSHVFEYIIAYFAREVDAQRMFFSVAEHIFPALAHLRNSVRNLLLPYEK